jgi:hypothetical protein
LFRKSGEFLRVSGSKSLHGDSGKNAAIPILPTLLSQNPVQGFR